MRTNFTIETEHTNITIDSEQTIIMVNPEHSIFTIDPELLRVAMEVSGLSTKKGMVECALKEYIDLHTRKELMELRGKIQFYECYDYKALRNGRCY
jgi:hypothetical protein